MNLNEYQRLTTETAIYPLHKGLVYCSLGIVSEAGEVAGVVKKILRDNEGRLTNDYRVKLMYELGDVLWYAAQIAMHGNLKLTGIEKRHPKKHGLPHEDLNTFVLCLGYSAGAIGTHVAQWQIDNDYSRQKLLLDIDDSLGFILAASRAICHTIGVSLEHVAEMNLRKLRKRQIRGALSGSGDDR